MPNVKLIILAMLTTMSVGCAPKVTPKVGWVSLSSVDEFTDQKSCRVTVGSIYTANSIYTQVGNFYPLIEKVNGELRVGLQSGGKIKIPVGNIQLRIDGNKHWDITTSETPLDLAPKSTVDMSIYTHNLPDEQRILVESSIKDSAKILSPYTMTIGDKAKKIVKEMLNGKKIIYRTVAINQGGSTTGEFVLDDSLKIALNQCGIVI